MTDGDLNVEWAWAQVEAMAEGGLNPPEKRRMQRAMGRDAALAAAVEDARRLRSELGRLRSAPVPGTLGRRLLAIPNRSGASTRWPGLAVPAAAAALGAVAGIAGLLVLEQTSRPALEREQAMQDFRLAMSYLQSSAALTTGDVARELMIGWHEAMAVSRSAVLEATSESQNGDPSDDQE